MVAVLLVSLLASAPPAPSASAASEQERFKTLVLEGEKFFAAGDLGMAIWAFREADSIRVTPEMAYNLAKLHERLGDAPTASYYYRLYLRRAPEASDALEVAEILGELLARAEADGRGLVEVDAPTQGVATLDGKTWVELPVAAFLPPGDYELEVKFPHREHRQTVSVLTGRTVTVHVEPLPPPLLNADGSSAATQVAKDASPGSGRQVLHVSSMVVMGLSAAALAAGTAFGAMSSAEAARLRTDKSTLTVSEARGVARSAGGKGAVANALWIAGGAGLVAGGAMFVFTLPEPGMSGSGGGAGRAE